MTRRGPDGLTETERLYFAAHARVRAGESGARPWRDEEHRDGWKEWAEGLRAALAQERLTEGPS